MKNLADLLVSYKLVEMPKQLLTENIELPSTRYLRMLNYLDLKQDTKEVIEDKPITNESSDGFIGWKFDNTPSTSTYTNSNLSAWSSPYSSRRNLWISDMTAAYKRAGLNDNAIKNLIAKNALESGWGKSAQGDYNFGNITAGKSWTGRIVEGGDKNAAGKAITLKFRAYDSLDDYVKDEILFLTNLYDFNLDDDISKFLDKLQGGNSAGRKYAEDPSYKNKVKSIYLKS